MLFVEFSELADISDSDAKVIISGGLSVFKPSSSDSGKFDDNWVDLGNSARLNEELFVIILLMNLAARLLTLNEDLVDDVEFFVSVDRR